MRKLTSRVAQSEQHSTDLKASFDREVTARRESIVQEMRGLEGMIQNLSQEVRDASADVRARRRRHADRRRLRPRCGEGRAAREPRRSAPAADREPAAAPHLLLRRLHPPAPRRRQGDHADGISRRRRAGEPARRHRQHAAVPLRADRAPAVGARPAHRRVLQHLDGLAGRRPVLPALPRLHAREPRPRPRDDLRDRRARVPPAFGHRHQQHGAADGARLPLLARQGRWPRTSTCRNCRLPA